MLSLKSLGTTFAMGATVLMGCTTHSANLEHSAPQAAAQPTLQSHHWELQQALTPQGTPDSQWSIAAKNKQPARTVKLDFTDDQRLSVKQLCNQISGGYSTSNDSIQISRLASTMMACSDDALMQLEKNVAYQLPKARAWRISDSSSPLLELQFDNGSTWQLKGTPTHETLYGPSARIFLEVAPQKVACNHPLIPNAQCLKVREVQYNDKGLQQGVGEWSNYYGSIEGYEHQPGVRNILRLKRFTRDKAPADTSKYVDVLDLVVQSEIVR